MADMIPPSLEPGGDGFIMSSAWDGTSCAHVDLFLGWNAPFWVNSFVFEPFAGFEGGSSGDVFHPHQF
jgi:hypothetical protein